MGKVAASLLAFNRGIVSLLALARVDVDRTRLSAEEMTNWLPRTSGAMRVRPGTKYLGSSRDDTGATFAEFVASTDTGVALLELTPSVMRVWDKDDSLITRPTRLTADIDTWFNSDTGGDTGGWVNKSTSGSGTSGFLFGPIGGDTGHITDSGLVLDPDGQGRYSRVCRKLTINAADAGVEFGVKINVSRGPVTFYAGSDTAQEDYFPKTSLYTGNHSLAVTPPDTGGIHFTFESYAQTDRVVRSFDLEDTGVVRITTPWNTPENLADVRYAQSADVVFVACYNRKQMRIERRGDGRSWSVVDYMPEEGPFFATPTSDARIKPNKTRGNIVLTSDVPFFKGDTGNPMGDTGHVGAIFRLRHNAQGGNYRFVGESVGPGVSNTPAYSPAWKVTGINDTGAPGERTTTIDTTKNAFNGDLSLQRSFESADAGFRTKQVITTQTVTTDKDGDDNITVYYRLGLLGDTGAFQGSGSITAIVRYPHGSQDGICRITRYKSPTQVDAEVLQNFALPSDTGEVPFQEGYSDDWGESRWSNAQSWPSGVVLHEGRLWWFGGSALFGSVSDDYENFNAATEGDAAPIVRTLALGPVDRVNWAASGRRLFIGTAGAEVSLLSSTQDEPLTATNMSAKKTSTQGSSNLRAVDVDDRVIFVGRSGKRLFMLALNETTADYQLQELTLLVPDLLTRVVDIAVQRQPDTRIHCVLDNGTVALLTYQDQEQVVCWSIWKSTAADGFVEKVAVLPGTVEDRVYYHVKRTINGATKRFLERWAMESESDGDTGANYIMDSAVEVTFTDTGVANDTGKLSHLEGEKTVVWRKKDLSTDDTGGNQLTHTVTSSIIQLDTGDTGAATGAGATVGLPFIKRVTGKEWDAEYKSTKLAYASEGGTALTMPKRVSQLGLILGKTHNNGLFYGPSHDTGKLLPLPRTLKGRILNDTGADRDEIIGVDTEFTPFPFPGKYDTNSRIVLGAKCPRPATLMAAIVGMQTNDKP